MSDPNDNEDFEKLPVTADVYRCTSCGNIDRCFIKNDHAACQECGSIKVNVYVRAPSRSELEVMRATRNNLSGEALEDALTEIDPDWRQRFGGDADRARDFYK